MKNRDKRRGMSSSEWLAQGDRQEQKRRQDRSNRKSRVERVAEKAAKKERAEKYYRTPEGKQETAARMLAEPTPHEKAMAEALDSQRIRFERQVIIAGYIVDFLVEDMLVLEVDGNYHEWNRMYDARRTVHLEEDGYRLFRFTNDEVEADAEGAARLVAMMLSFYRHVELVRSPEPHADRHLADLGQELREARAQSGHPKTPF